MKALIKKGATSQLVQIFIQDSSSTTGAGLTGLTSGSTGLVCYRARQDDGNAAATQLSLSGGTRGTWSSGGFVEKDATNMPGLYELGLDNAGLVTGVDRVIYMLKGVTNMAPLALEIELVAFDPQSATTLGLTNLDATVSSRLASASISLSGGAVTVGTNSDKTGYALTSGERTSVADALLDRDMSTGTDSGSTTVRTVRNALRFLRNKWSISGTTMTVCKEDDTTTAWTAVLTATAGANPVTASDPAG